MGRKQRVAILFGGQSAEHEVSILSARNVLAALDPDRFEPVLIGIDRDGRWRLQEPAHLLAQPPDPRRVALNRAAPDVTLPVRAAAAVQVGDQEAPVDVVFPVLHGPLGEDGTVQGLLELAGLPYVGAGVAGSAVGMDKDLMKRLLSQAGVPVVPWATLRAWEWRADRAGCVARCRPLGPLRFTKPANLGSSVGVSRVEDDEGLIVGVDEAFRHDRKVIVEQGIPGVREIECGVIGDDDPAVSVAGEIRVDHPDGFYSYQAKYVDETGATAVIPADLTPGQAAEVQRLAVAAFRALEARGLARVDLFLAPDGALYVNEINTLPGFTAISMFPKLWEASGLPVRDLVTRLIELAQAASPRR